MIIIKLTIYKLLRSVGEKMTEVKDLKPFIQAVWEKNEFSSLTNVQQQVLPLALEGKDIIAESPTGTGKTLAYLLPILEKIDEKRQNVQAVIVAPSQELGMQILSEIQKWTQGSKITSTSLIGGANVQRQIDKLKKSPHVVVGTPGRMMELIKQKKLKMHAVKTIVIDECDQLVIGEHQLTVQEMIKMTLADRQVICVSATLNKEIQAACSLITKDAVVVSVEKDDSIPEGKVEHIYFKVEARDRMKMLGKVSRLENAKVLAFVRDIGNLNVLKEKLAFEKINAHFLHSDLDKTARQKALQEFRSGKVNLLMATDVAARGLDISDVTHVLHYDFPKDYNQYVHRSGRTGRFGKDGIVISFVDERQEREVKKFANMLNVPLAPKMFRAGEIVPLEVKKVAAKKTFTKKFKK